MLRKTPAYVCLRRSLQLQALIAGLFVVFLLTASGCKKDPPQKDPETVQYTKGTLVTDQVFSPSLENNLLSDPPTRKVSIYLPPAYDEEEPKSYAVLYLLHGFMCDHTTFFGGTFHQEYGIEGNKGFYMKKMLDTLIRKEYIQPMIVVCPNVNNTYDGSWYCNSIVTGQWEDFIVEDLVAYVDANYRTLPDVGSRGIAGHSMGAHGSMRLAMKHPDVFCAVYAMSGTAVSIETLLDIHKDEIIVAMQREYYDRFEPEPWYRIPISLAVAMAPNPDLEPFMGEFPYDEGGSKVDSVWHEWLKHDPVSLLDAYQTQVEQLKAIRFDCGTGDAAMLSNSTLSKALTAKNILHEFTHYTGDHNDMIPTRMAEEVLPFFSALLEHSGD